MLRKSLFTVSLVLTLAATGLAQGASSAATQPAQEIIPIERIKKSAPRPTPAPKSATAQAGASAQAAAVREAFDSLVDGIRRTDAEGVMKLYWNSPQLAIFNNNGTVTRGWTQAHSNRVSLYEKTKDVKLDVRDVRVKTLGPGAAIVTCLWEQTQTADGQSEHATGRLTLVYQKIGADWKIVHTHTSPDRPNPSNLLPSERMQETDENPAKPPVKPEADKTPLKPPAKN